MQYPSSSNAVVVIDTRLKSRELLIELQRIELDMGRERSEEDEGHESRTIDLDIIDLEGQLSNTPLLKLPHPSHEAFCPATTAGDNT